MNIGERIKLRRESLGITQEELAKKMGYTSHTTVSKVEKGINDINQSTISKYAKYLQTTEAYLMGWAQTPSLPEPGILTKSPQPDFKALAEKVKARRGASAETIEEALRESDYDTVRRIHLYSQYLMEIKKDEN